ncbi:hypothetical protein [Acinetobacter bereziniae]|uniref:hypothetical protein n=1 Tax=Acinetobacter bereziniae TaxID=106648 RepID=UPI001D183652|nr:hypothetical protein [Acinetobacter bereziniae]
MIDWQGTILGAQLTIVCVVYPLVISFISIFANQKTSNSVIFPIYKKYSGFMFAGLSGLALAVFILISFFYRSFLDDSSYLALCIASAIWLIFNLFLTSWFFSKTFKIINDHSREEIILRFSIQEACRIDISKRLKNLYINQALYYGLIREADKKNLKISNFFLDDTDISLIERKIKINHEISDIKFYILNFIVFIQTYFLKYKKIEDTELYLDIGKISDDIYLLGKTKKFTFPPLLNYIYKKSFSFNKIKAIENDEELLKLFKNFIDPIHIALRDNDIRAFKEAIDNLINYHVNVSSTLAFINNNKKNDNWLLLTDGSFFGRSYFDYLLIEYFLISKESVFKIIINTEFYNEILSFHKRLYSLSTSLTDNQIKTHITQNYNLWEVLLEWYSLEVDKNTRTNKNYKEILYKFVSSWENWIQHYIGLSSKKDYRNDQILLAYKTHLRYTAKTIIAALSFKNPQALGWGVDLLNHWLENFESRSVIQESYMWNSTSLNIFMLNISEDDPIWAEINNSDNYSLKSVYELAFANYHIDLRVITACYILKKHDYLTLGFAKEMIKALLNGQRIHPTSISENPKCISNAGELLGAYIRQRNYSQFIENSYGSLLNEVIESYAYLFKEQLITGRTYMGTIENINSLKENYIEILLSLSKKQWDLPNTWYQTLSSSLYRTTDIDSIISDLESWITTLDSWQEEKYEFILFERDDFTLLKQNFKISIQNIIDKLNTHNKQTIIEASISNEKILALEVIASTSIEDSIHKYPFNLFKFNSNSNNKINFKKNIFKFTNYNKEYLIDGFDKNILINESEWIQQNIVAHLKKTILYNFLNTPTTHNYSSRSLEDLIQKIAIQMDKIEEPLLLVGNQELKNILNRLRRSKNNFLSEIINFKNISDKGYICHINKCEVYDIFFDDVNEIFLTSKRFFDFLTIYKYNQSNFFDVSYELKNPNDLTGDLIFQYKIDLKFNEDHPVLKFNLDFTEDS